MLASLNDLGATIDFGIGGDIEFSGFGTRIHIWNLCDTSRIRCTNVLLNGSDPLTASVNNNWHGPTGRWITGAALDYYGKFGLYAWDQWSTNTFRNTGIFRLMVGGRGALKSMYELAYATPTDSNPDAFSAIPAQVLGGGSPADQLNAQGYQTIFDIGQSLDDSDITHAKIIGENDSSSLSGVSYLFGGGLPGYFQRPGKINGVWTHAGMKEGIGMKFDLGQLHPQLPVAPLNMAWEGYLDNQFDKSAASLFANARHGANKKVNLLSIVIPEILALTGGEGRDTQTPGLEGLSFGLGVRSLNTFELTQLV